MAPTDALSLGNLRTSLARLRQNGVIPAVATALGEEIDATAGSLVDFVLGEIPSFSESANPDVRPELRSHAQEHVNEIYRLLAGGSPGDFPFVRAHAERRAEQRFPLEATLHAYRCGHRVISKWIRDAAIEVLGNSSGRVVSDVADFAIDYTDTISTILAAEYVARTRSLAEVDSDRRVELLEILLEGYDESDGRVARLLRQSGYLAQRQAYCVVLARAPDAREMENAARAGRMAEAIARAVAGLPIRLLIGVRNGRVTAVFSATRRQSGWTAPRSALSGRIRDALMTVGPAALIGVSGDQPSTSYVPRGLAEAEIALEFASVAERVVAWPDLPLRRVLLHGAGDSVRTAVPAWTAELLAADDRAHGRLVDTLRAYAEADMNVLGAARALDAHPNTVYDRLRRIEDMTGIDGRRFHGLNELLLAVDITRS